MPETPETPETLILRYVASTDELQEIEGQVAALNAEILPLHNARQASHEALAKLTRERHTLRTQYRALTGRELKKSLRTPTAEIVDQTHARLLAAVAEPAYLPPTDPIVIRRLEEYRDAITAHRKAKADARIT